MAVPDFQIFRKAGEQATDATTAQGAAAIFPSRATGDFPAEFLHEELHTVANTKDGDAEMKNAAIHLGRLGGIHTGRSAAQNDAPGMEGENFAQGDVVGHNLGEDLGLTDPAGDDLGVLGTEVQDQDPFLDSVGTR